MDVDAPPDVVAVLKVLGEPAHRRIAERLAAEELCVCHLVQDLDLAQPLVSHHLMVLRDAGIVTSERWKQWVYHRLVPGAVAAVADDIATLADPPPAGERRRACC